MKKLFGKALAMAVMMSVLAGGQAYAADFSRVILAGRVDNDEEVATSGVHVNVYKDSTLDEHSSLYEDSLYFFDKDGKKAVYGNSSIELGNIILDTTTGLNMSGLDISGVKNLTVTGTLNASASGAIASGDTGLVNGGTVYTALQDKADAATTLAGYGITDGATKTELEGKADKATTLAGYGITDGATKTELDAETTARKDADADLQKQIDAISGGSSAGLNELNNKINQTNDRVDRVGATAAA